MPSMPRRRSLIGTFAAALAFLACAAAPASAKLYEIGSVTGAEPTCPQQDDQTCLALSRTTGYQVRVGSDRGPYRIPRDGKIVAWTVKLGDPSADEIADRLKMPVSKVRLLLDAQKTPYSLEMKIGEDEGTELGDILRDRTVQSPEDTALESDLSNEVERALAPLSDREKEVLRLRYGLGTDREYTLEEIGRRLSVTRERVRQIEARALSKLRSNGRAA